MNTSIFGYAPGKVILVGEHAVVYGQPALAAPIDRGVRVVVGEREDRAGTGPVLKGRAMDLGSPSVFSARPAGEGSPGLGPQAMRDALEVLVDIFGEQTRDLQLQVTGTIPAGAGLGSSAALSVALVRALHRWAGDEQDAALVLEQALQIERVFHGNPSGVDHTAIARGGLTWFHKGDAEDVSVARDLEIVVGLAGPHAGTAHAVGLLKQRHSRHEAHFARIFDGLGEIARSARDAVETGRHAALGELFDIAQGYLNALGVSTPNIEKMCHLARDAGALGAKLTGAGLGGAVIALVDDDKEPIIQAFEGAGIVAFSTRLLAQATGEKR